MSLSESDGYGADKAARNAAQAAEKADENKPAPLEPTFPWTVEPFPFYDLTSPAELINTAISA